MSLLGFQTALARVLTDDDVRSRFLSTRVGDPLPDELASEDLSPKEVHSLQTIPRERLELYTQMLFEKRARRMVDTLPWTMVLLREGDLVSLLREYCRSQEPKTISKLEEARSFTEFLARNRERLLYPYTVDVARYEVVNMDFAHGGRPEPTLDLDLLDRARYSEVVCRISSNVRIEEFDHDLEQALPALREKRVPRSVARRKTVVLVRRPTTDDLLAKSMQIDASTQLLLSQCDGSAYLADIISRLCARMSADESARPRVEHAIEGAIRMLVQRGVLVLAWRDTPSPGAVRSRDAEPHLERRSP